MPDKGRYSPHPVRVPALPTAAPAAAGSPQPSTGSPSTAGGGDVRPATDPPPLLDIDDPQVGQTLHNHPLFGGTGYTNVTVGEHGRFTVDPDTGILTGRDDG